jgi:hypothetical protein
MQNIQEALSFVLSRAGLSESESSRILTDLQETAGIGTMGQIVYRPYYLAGKELWLSTDNNLKKAEGAEFDQNFEVPRRYLSQQLLMDKQFKLDISEEYSAAFLLSLLSPENVSLPSVPLGFMSF